MTAPGSRGGQVPGLPFLGPERPAVRGPGALLLWIGRRQAVAVLLAVVLGVVGFACSAAQPYLLGRAFDSFSGAEFPRWLGLMAAVALISLIAGVLGRRWDTWSSTRASLRTAHLLLGTVSRAGRRVRDLPAGEVVAAVTGDTMRIGEVFGIVAHLVGCLVTYGVVVVVMCGQSLLLGGVIALGLPVVALVLALLVKPLQARQHGQREAQGRLTAISADIASGLRVLRGIGGEAVFGERYRERSGQVRAAGMRVATTQSVLDGLQVLLPGLFVCLVLFLAVREAIAGRITTGQLVSFYGYASSLSWPIHVLVQSTGVLIRARVAARHVLDVLNIGEETGGRGAAPVPAGAVLRDAASGVEVAPGRSIGLVSSAPGSSAAVASRLGGLADDDAPVTLGGVPLASLDREEVRRRIVVAEAEPYLFSGPLARELAVRDDADRRGLDAVLEVADAHDVLRSIPGGLEGRLGEDGRTLSGGQRQRLALARALLADPEILVLVEPTSAVDAHTEARIARRLARHRRGRTTVVVTASPLVLDHLDEVVFLEDGRPVARGTHRELLGRSPDAPDGAAATRYRAVVGRSIEPDPLTTDGAGALT